jgi:hypothetical protein
MDMFSNRNGVLIKYAILVIETDNQGHPVFDTAGAAMTQVIIDVVQLTMPRQNWQSVQAATTGWQPYIAIVRPMASGARHLSVDPSITETIGVEQDCMQAMYCNGALMAGKYYRAVVRVFTRDDLFVDTDYSQMVKTGEAH